MATTIKPADLTVTIAESVLLNGFEQGTTNTYTISDVNEVQRRIINCNGSLETTLIKFGPYGAGASRGPEIHVDDVRYLRITNLDDAFGVALNFQIDTTEHDTTDPSVANHNAAIALAPGQSFVMGTVADCIAVSDSSVTSIDYTASLNDLESIIADVPDAPGSTGLDIELFVALV
jgi:hypothetical protein